MSPPEFPITKYEATRLKNLLLGWANTDMVPAMKVIITFIPHLNLGDFGDKAIGQITEAIQVFKPDGATAATLSTGLSDAEWKDKTAELAGIKAVTLYKFGHLVGHVLDHPDNKLIFREHLQWGLDKNDQDIRHLAEARVIQLLSVSTNPAKDWSGLFDNITDFSTALGPHHDPMTRHLTWKNLIEMTSLISKVLTWHVNSAGSKTQLEQIFAGGEPHGSFMAAIMTGIHLTTGRHVGPPADDLTPAQFGKLIDDHALSDASFAKLGFFKTWLNNRAVAEAQAAVAPPPPPGLEKWLDIRVLMMVTFETLRPVRRFLLKWRTTSRMMSSFGFVSKWVYAPVEREKHQTATLGKIEEYSDKAAFGSAEQWVMYRLLDTLTPDADASS